MILSIRQKGKKIIKPTHQGNNTMQWQFLLHQSSQQLDNPSQQLDNHE